PAEATAARISLRTEATEADLAAKSVQTTPGSLTYDKLPFATGGRPKGTDADGGERAICFRAFSAYRRLRHLSSQNLSSAVVGGGFIGTELAAALAQNETRTTLIFDDDTLGGSIFPPDLAKAFHELYRSHGVTLLPGTKASGGRIDGDRVVLDFDAGSYDFDAVVVGLGIDPETGLAEAARLDTDDGIIVDESLRTSQPDVFAAGDGARYPDRSLGRQRVEHVDNATQMGTAVGRIMAGAEEAYTHTPYFYTNVFDFGYQAIGDLDPSLRTVEDWQHDPGDLVSRIA